MAFKPGKDAHILMDGVAGSLVNITSYADNFSFPQPVDTIEVSVFGNSSKQFITGLTDGGQVGISGPADVALGTFLAGVRAAQAAGSSTSTITYSPAGSIAGQLKISAECWVGNMTLQGGVGGRVEYDGSLQITGAVTTTTW